MRLAHYVHLVDTKFTKWSNFVREAWLIKEKWNKRSCLKPPMNADARRCSAPLIGVDRRPSAGSLPPRGGGWVPSLACARPTKNNNNCCKKHFQSRRKFFSF